MNDWIWNHTVGRDLDQEEAVGGCGIVSDRGEQDWGVAGKGQ